MSLVASIAGIGQLGQAVAWSPPAAPVADYPNRMLSYGPVHYWRLAGGTGDTSSSPAALTNVNGVEFGRPTLVAESASGGSASFSAIGSPGHFSQIGALDGLSACTLLFALQTDKHLTKHNVVSVHDDVAPSFDADAAGIELEDAGSGTLRVRIYRWGGAALHILRGAAGQTFPVGGVAHLAVRFGADGSTAAFLDGAAITLETVTGSAPASWPSFSASTLYLGCYQDGASAPFDGLMAEVAVFPTALSNAAILDLHGPSRKVAQVVYMAGFSAGTLTGSGSIDPALQSTTHPATGLTAHKDGNPATGTVTDSGGVWNYTAGTAGQPANFQGHVAKGGVNSSPSATVSGTWAAATAAIPLQAFTRATIDVTARADWPAGRTPKAVLAQGARASAYVRRAWKSTNVGRVDFVAGWRKTTAPETIRMQLDNDSEIDLQYIVDHAIPSPTGSGVTRTLDRSGGGNFTDWNTAIANLTSGDVLVVRAPIGTWTDSGGHAIPNYVYDSTAAAAPAAGVANVKVVAYPEDVKAGRRPVIWRNAGRYARYKYAAANAWQVHQALAGGLTVYQSVVTHTAPQISLFGAYRDQAGDWMAMYNYQTMIDTTPRDAIMHDTAYPGYSGVNTTTYMGPSAIHNRTTNRIEIRLDAPKEQTYHNPSGASPWPPWDWTKHYPSSTDPRLLECIFVDGGDSSNINYLLNLTSRNGWEFYNIDFVYGNSAINASSLSTPPKFFGCSFVGGAPVSFYNTGGDAGFQVAAIAVRINTEVAHTSDMLFDRCNLQGHCPPWSAWSEGKGNEGAFGITTRRAMTSSIGGRFVYRYCHIAHWFHLVWDGGGHLNKLHWHHCRLLQHGVQDGAIVTPAGSINMMVNRCHQPSSVVTGFSSGGGAGILYHQSFLVDLRLHPATCTKPNFGKWANSGNRATVGAGTAAFTAGISIPHGGHSQYTERKYFCTCVGTQNTFPIEMGSAGEGAGSGLGPDTRRGNNRIRNSIGAVYPPPIAWPGGFGSFVAVYSTRDGGNEYDNNLLFKHGSMLAPGGANGRNTFMVVTTAQPTPSFTSHASLASLQGAGFELNGKSASPQFVVTPAYASTDPHAAGGAFDMGNYMLGPSSPARTGGANLNGQAFPDYDFEVLTTFAGGTNCLFMGALDPSVPLLEQEVGIVGPAPPSLV